MSQSFNFGNFVLQLTGLEPTPQSFNWSDFVLQLLPSVIALAAIVSCYLYTRTQIRANTVSAARMKWIGDLRAALADLVTQQAVLLYRQIRIGEEPSMLIAEKQAQMLSMYKCRLLLNPTNPDHSKLLLLLEKITEATLSEKPNAAEHRNLRNAIAENAIQLIQNEWAKVKRFE